MEKVIKQSEFFSQVEIYNFFAFFIGSVKIHILNNENLAKMVEIALRKIRKISKIEDILVIINCLNEIDKIGFYNKDIYSAIERQIISNINFYDDFDKSQIYDLLNEFKNYKINFNFRGKLLGKS